MLKILADASLPNLDVLFQAPFTLTRYGNHRMLQNALPHHDILLCRSTLHVTPKLLENTQLTCIATASSGTDHIDATYLKTHDIALFDAKGCNAEAVTDYVRSTLAYLKQQNKLPSLQAGVMGVGKVGSRVAKQLKQLGFSVVLYDPPKAARDSNFTSSSFEAFMQCDVLCIHANLHQDAPYPTRHALDTSFFENIKPNAVIINAARGGIVDEQALLNTTMPFIYCTDVYQNEPNINPELIAHATLCTPHIAGHSIEAKEDAVFYVSQAIHQHFNLTPPTPPTRHMVPKPISASSTTGYEHALELYNPELETNALKQAQDKHEAFLTLRKAHQQRHNFSAYLNKD
jgi:erythronate-4-phosphate dehydrogenase